MSVSFAELERIVRAICKSRKISQRAADLIVDDYVGAHREGKTTHGVGKLLLLDDAISLIEGDPVVERRDGALAIIDGRASLGHEVAALAIEIAIEAAASLGVAAVGMRNFSRYGRLKPIGLHLANKGFASIVTNGGGPAAIVPPGTRTPVLGTNPICIAIPGDPPFVADLATSERPWGAIRESLINGTPLPANAFLDASGSPTTDPKEANAVLAFGGPKGFALAAGLELLTGALLTDRIGETVESQLELGAWIIALKADSLRTAKQVSESVGALRQQIADAEPAADQANLARRVRPPTDAVDIAPELLATLQRMSEGQLVTAQSNRLTD